MTIGRFVRINTGFMAGALTGIRVLDLSRVLAGPWASQLLADFGADVIKVERPDGGDETRHWGPPWLRDREDGTTLDAAYFLASNRNKRSLTLDIRTAAGQRIVRELAARSDILLENFRVGTLKKYGLDAATLRSRHPSLIYCSISAFGQEGPRSRQPGYDAVIQASAGLMSITGEEHGPPVKTGVAVADLLAGMYAAAAILAALNLRQKSGVGQHIDVPLYDVQVASLANQAMNYLVSGEIPQRRGNAHPNIVPYQTFATADGYLMLAVGNDRQFEHCVGRLGLAHLARDGRFSTNAARVEHRDALIPLLAAPFGTKGTSFWVEELTACGVPCGPVNDLRDVFSSDQVVQRQLLTSLAHPRAGEVPMVNNPVRFSDTPARLRSAPPALGQHTEEVLRRELGYGNEQIAELKRKGTI